VTFTAWGGRTVAGRFPNAGAVMAVIRPLWAVEEALGSVSASLFLVEHGCHTSDITNGIQYYGHGYYHGRLY
jgi:hypothetical protein